MLREKREQLSILHHHTPTFYARTATEKFTALTHCQEQKRKIQNNLYLFIFFILKEEQI